MFHILNEVHQILNFIAYEKKNVTIGLTFYLNLYGKIIYMVYLILQF